MRLNGSLEIGRLFARLTKILAKEIHVFNLLYKIDHVFCFHQVSIASYFTTDKHLQIKDDLDQVTSIMCHQNNLF